MKFHPKSVQKIFDELGSQLFIDLRAASRESTSDFALRYLPVIERLGMQLQELPLSKASFGEPLGAMRFALKSGLTALRLSDAVIFSPTASSQERMQTEPQYRFAAFCAAIASAPILVNHHLSIKINDVPWSMASPLRLFDAAKEHGYEIAWRPIATKPPLALMGLVLCGGIFNPGQFASLNSDVLAHFCEAVNPNLQQITAESPLAKTVRTAQEKVKEAEAKRVQQIFTLLKPEDLVQDLQASAQRPSETIEASQSNESSESRADKFVRSSEIKDQQIIEWAGVVAKQMPTELNLRPDGRIIVSKKALSFGIGQAAMYAMIQKNGLVSEKTEAGFIGTNVLGDEFKKHMKA